MHRTALRRAALALALALGLAVAGCTTTVPGSPRAMPDPVPAGTERPSEPEPVPDPLDPAPPPPSGPRSALAADVVADECLLDPGQLGALLGRPVGDLAQRALPETAGTACWAFAADDGAVPLAAINVYSPLEGTPADFVRNAPREDRRDLTGAGEAAVVLGTDTGPTLQLAHTRYVVTIVALDAGTAGGSGPDDAAWRAAATSALADLPG